MLELIEVQFDYYEQGQEIPMEELYAAHFAAALSDNGPWAYPASGMRHFYAHAVPPSPQQRVDALLTGRGMGALFPWPVMVFQLRGFGEGIVAGAAGYCDNLLNTEPTDFLMEHGAALTIISQRFISMYTQRPIHFFGRWVAVFESSTTEIKLIGRLNLKDAARAVATA